MSCSSAVPTACGLSKREELSMAEALSPAMDLPPS